MPAPAQYAYDPDNYLLSASRGIQTYIERLMYDHNIIVQVESGYPEYFGLTEVTPFDKPHIHVDIDDFGDRVMGFGQYGVEDVDVDAQEVTFKEAVHHELTFDIGVWCFLENGGGSKRMEITQVLKSEFTSVYGKQRFNTALDSVKIVSFNGGRFALDRINDLPVWRTLDLSLVVRCFSRHLPVQPDILLSGEFELDPQLTITGSDGEPEDLATP